MSTPNFNELLQAAEKLASNIEGTSELPTVERSLRQVLEASHELYTRVAQSGSQDVQANLLLGSQGVDLPRITQKLEQISSARTFEPVKPTADTDIHAHLENELRNMIVEVVESEFKRCSDKSKDNFWAWQDAEWREKQTKILNSMTAPSGKFLHFPRPPTILVEPFVTTSFVLGNQESLYAVKLMEYNKSVIRGNPRINLVTSFASAAEEFKDTKVNNMWEIVKYMTELPPFPCGESATKTRNSKAIIKVLISQGKKYLEDRYKTYMTNVINENLAEARRGGMPGTYSLVRSFVGVRLQGRYSGLQGGMVDERPVWPIVYYCLRSGDLAAAIHCLKQASSETKNVLALLEMKFKNPENPDIEKLETTLQVEYRRITHNSTDPFQRIVYAVLSCSDTTDEHSEVAKTADDYLWVKLSYLRMNSQQDDSDAYRGLQTTIVEEYGESHYNAFKQPHLYFQMLALTGQFESAFEFLARIERYQIHGVHMMIAMNELHMLASPKSPASPILTYDPMDPKPTRLLNISKLVTMYTHRFEISAPKEATEYYFLLRNLFEDKDRSVFVTCVIDLAVETCEYEMLFGKLQSNGLRSKGHLDNFATTDIKVETVANEVGRTLVERGQFEDAIELYDYANNQEETLYFVCRQLGQVVCQQTTEGSIKQRLVRRANDIAARYASIGYNCCVTMMSSFLILKDLAVFFDQYHAKQFNMALKTLQDIQIVPRQQSEVEEKIAAFKRFDMNVYKSMSDVVLANMNILFALYQSVKSSEYIPSQYQDASQDTQLAYLREQAKTLTYFAGLLPYCLPSDTNSRLVQMEILMH